MLGRFIVLSLTAYRAHSHKSLSTLGILIAIITGIIHALADSALELTLLVTFFVVGSQATKYKHDLKSKYTKVLGNGSDDTTRSYVQVLSNSFVATLLILGSLLTLIPTRFAKVGTIVNYCAVTADTLSSEIGILSQETPVLCYNWSAHVPRGTNGAISRLGLWAGFCGSFLIALVSAAFLKFGLKQLIFFTVSGVIGSLIDSLLGAFCQLSLLDSDLQVVVEGAQGERLAKDLPGTKPISGTDLLSNNAVNLLMSAITTFLFAFLIDYLH
ncbi:hypothetical protein KL938_005307 [Ogataea parapolymorpha]|nr:hypothetical protein KL938_005307 [Ogataea parapolymorpha]